jgi:TPR repeat protein
MEDILSFENDCILYDYTSYDLYLNDFQNKFEKNILNINLQNYSVYKNTNVYKMINLIQNNVHSKIHNSNILFIIGEYYYYYYKNYEKAIEYYQKAIDQDNNSIALNKLGLTHFFGNGVEQNYQKAIKYFQKAINKDNNSNALNNLGMLYHDGRGVEQNYQKAIEYYQKAIEQNNNSDALNNLGILYDNGKGVEQNYHKAIEYYQKAIEQDNNSDALNRISLLYYYGNGVEQNYQKAIEYYEKAIEQDNNSNALAFLGDIYERGAGVEVNYQKAIEYYEKAIEEDNNSNALAFLGDIYERGVGVEVNYQKAIEYYQKSIEQNDNNIYALKYITRLYYSINNYKKYYYYFDLSIINNVEIDTIDYEKLEEINIKELSELYYKFKSSTLKIQILDIIFNTLIPKKNISYAYDSDYIHIFLRGVKEGLFNIDNLHKKIFMTLYEEYCETTKSKMENKFNVKIPKLLTNTVLEFL